MHAVRTLLLTLLVAAPLAGCLTDRSPPGLLPPQDPGTPAFVNGTWPDGASARGYIESYIMTHPYRVQNPAFQAFMDTARDSLVAELEGMAGNYTVVRQAYEGANPGVNILAFKNGTTNPEQWVVLSAHYDTIGAGVGTTVYGAWDDGAGVATLLELARAFSDWQFPYTLVFAFFDGEEKGLVGSREFVRAYEENATVDLLANLNTDPPGLNWPCGDATGPFPVKAIKGAVAERGMGPARSEWLFAAVLHALNATGVPEEVRDLSAGIPIATVMGGGLRGGSDHMSFGAAGFANVFLGGTPTTTVPFGSGPDDAVVAALTYPLHTPLDTLEAMDARCASGGAGSSLAGGLQTIADIFAHALSWMALNPAPTDQ